MKNQITDLLSDGERYTLAEIASACLVPGIFVMPKVRELVTDGIIQYDGLKNQQECWRRRNISSRQVHLDEEVDKMTASKVGGHQPNDETKFVPPLGDDTVMAIDAPGLQFGDEPHWILDAMGWVQRHEGDGSKSPPPGDSPIRWMGGKSKMLKDLISWYPEHHTYVEAFGGSLKPFFAKAPSKIEVVNDFYNELVNFWRVSTQWPEQLAAACNSVPASRALHRLFQRQDGTRTPWERAVMFGSLIRFSFNGKPWSSFGGSAASPPTRIDQDLLVACAARLSDGGVYIENLDFRVLIKRYNKKLSSGKVFFYLDPPYFQTAGYADDFPDEWHRDLAGLMEEINEAGNLVLMTNSPPAMKAYKNWLPVESFWFDTYTVKYSASGGTSGRGDVEETIVSNFKLKVSSQKRQTGMFK